jgi:hypothetical protein
MKKCQASSWARQLRAICDRDDEAFIFKQWIGGRSQAGAFSMMKSGVAFRDRSFLNPSSMHCSPRILMPPRIKNYQGREQSFIKQLFLKEYLESAASRLFRARSPAFYFLNAFADAWRVSNTEKYSDASFSHAIATLDAVRRSLLDMGRPISVTLFTYWRWRKENEPLRKAVSDFRLGKLILREAASGSF